MRTDHQTAIDAIDRIDNDFNRCYASREIRFLRKYIDNLVAERDSLRETVKRQEAAMIRLAEKTNGDA